MSKLTEILKGWSNLTLEEFDLLDEKTKELSEKRFSICDSCPVREENICSRQKSAEVMIDFKFGDEDRVKGQVVNGCGCYLPAKNKSTSQCPRGLWENIKIKEK